ncbi:beta/gamma crystallin domain-containing protein [Microbispora sp. NPDC049633]|uniref:beta/gamma crystallin domain-containing protein n=1 Tax=Microbispora sp. NPDC049633 TaxID=3154355 RepID=UPI003445FBC7
MKRITKRAAVATLASVAVTASLTVALPTAAYAINEVPCAGRTDLVRATIHATGSSSTDYCYANAGEDMYALNIWWVTRISTGNNRVQWYGDGRWQPAQPIPQWTVFTWPNHPGGVRIQGIRIV